jgi:signal peptidase I
VATRNDPKTCNDGLAEDNMSDEFDDEDDFEPTGFVGWLWDAVTTWGPALLAVLLIRSVIAEPFRIPSGSMVPTLQIGDHILVTKYSYGMRIPLTRIPVGNISLPERGDVVVFVYPGSDDDKMSYWFDLPFPPLATLDYVKRIVALPGDEVEVRDNVLYINGDVQTRTFLERQDFIDDSCIRTPTKHYTEEFDGAVHEILTATTFGSRLPDYPPHDGPRGARLCHGRQPRQLRRLTRLGICAAAKPQGQGPLRLAFL